MEQIQDLPLDNDNNNNVKLKCREAPCTNVMNGMAKGLGFGIFVTLDI
jgi:hypothetical protein